MKYSIVIPVFERNNILKNCLESVLNQHLKPIEVIIVDNNKNNYESIKLNNLISKPSYDCLNIRILKSYKNSGAIARNIGAKSSKGDVVAFLDSDVILDSDYYDILIKYFSDKKNLIAIQGTDRALIESQKKDDRNNFFYKIFYYFEQFFETSLIFNKKSAYVSPSMAVAHPNVKNDFEVSSQWISTCAGLFKRDLFEDYSFPSQFVTYSNNEYLLFSHQLFLDKRGEMIYTSKAKYRDIQTSVGRIPLKSLMYQIQTYDLFIFVKLFNMNPLKFLIFLKSRIGHLILNLIKLITKRNFSFKNLFYAFHSIMYPFLNIRSIINEDLSFYEKDFPL